MEAELGWNRAELTGAFSLALIVLAIAGVGVGQWLDRRGPRLLMSAGSTLGVALMVGWSQVRDLGSFYAIWVLMGLCWSATLYSPAFATITAHFRERRTEALTLVTLMAGLASTIFYPLDLVARLAARWRSALVAPRGDPRDHHDPAARADPAVAQRGGASHSSFSLGAALRHPASVARRSGSSASLSAMGGRDHPFVSERPRHDLGTAAAIAGLVGAMQVVGRLLFAPVERRVPASALVAAVYALQPLSLLVLLLIPGMWAPFAFVVLYGSGRGIDTLLRNTAVARLYGPRRFASIQGVGVRLTLALAAGPVGLGAVYDRFGGYEPGLWAVAAASVVAVVAVTWGTRAGVAASER